MEQLQKAAKVAFASEFTFYLKAQFFHWNVEGINFRELHDLFGTIYGEVYDSIDDFAEKIRALGAYAPGSNSRFNALTRISDETEVLPAEQMIIELLQDSDNMVVLLKRVYDIAEAEGEHGFSNFLAERMDAHRKHSWQLRATAK
ncbi:Dps DNA-binding ferritin-like protein (oxidative damage protectant) [uncultured Caudovirales phage]|uniref:Dps DNA-binding ferritin-like protein (Oxidative damage protectant) n=1 Tax=uncultured Caudovirales phage TaxID=2100421 RepID=A0A6J7WPS2_9CAUD|nr:Dps DNA-binding ferritin-like protein (oxidative damage protectant) [uncultured Caudovirales phage]